MNQLENDLRCFQGLPLEKLDDIKLLKRYDTKFVFHREKLPSVFDYLHNHYGILEINNNRTFKYESLYFDTDDYFLYHQHHNKKLNRYKIRCRRYIDSNQCYFEIKFKNNKKKTIKTRLLLEDKIIKDELSDISKEFGRKCILKDYNVCIDNVGPKLRIEFDRITLASQLNKERFTFDLNLTYTVNGTGKYCFNNLIIAELKSEKISLNPEFRQYLKSLKIFPTTFSKYCIGIAMTNNQVKSNRFKKTLLKLNHFN
jgi:hypothetical protein